MQQEIKPGLHFVVMPKENLMEQKNKLKQVVLVLLIALIVLACSGGTLAATVTPAPTNTPLPTNTLLPTSTPLPPPTETFTPEPPTPSSMGSVAKSEFFEIKVIDAVVRDRVYPGGKFYFTPADGYMLVDIGVKVTNLTSSSLQVRWDNVYIMNTDQEWWYPNWGTFKDTAGDLDPFTIGVSEIEINPDLELTLKKTGYLRLFYHLPKANTYYFAFGDSPFTEIKFK